MMHYFECCSNEIKAKSKYKNNNRMFRLHIRAVLSLQPTAKIPKTHHHHKQFYISYTSFNANDNPQHYEIQVV
jgi:hypothetical protein